MRRRDLLKLAPALLLPAAALASPGPRSGLTQHNARETVSEWLYGLDSNTEGEFVQDIGIVVSESDAHAEWAKDVGRPPRTEAEKRAAFCSHALRLANAAASA